MLDLDDLTITAGGRVLFAHFSLTVAPGTITTLMGPSGSGKSTLLDVICGCPQPGIEARGRIRLDGRDLAGVPPERRRIGILFQDALLFPHMSVGENLAFALPRSIRNRNERRARVEAALADADLAGFADRDPATLSGGQRARVAAMRALLARAARAFAG